VPPGEDRVWLEQLRRRLDPSDLEQRRLGHELLEAVATDDHDAAERVAAEMSRLAGVDPPPPRESG
jgi:hypothetical protein